MATLTISVESRIAGALSEKAPLDEVFLNLVEERITVRELIRRTVEEQVHELVVTHNMEYAEARKALDRQYLSPAEIRRQAEDEGAIRYPSKGVKDLPQIDRRAETEKALSAFEQQRYFILIDGRQVESLEEQITFEPRTKVTFLRLIPLAGG